NGYGIFIDSSTGDSVDDDISLTRWENGVLKEKKKIGRVNDIVKYTKDAEIDNNLKARVNILCPSVHKDGRICLGNQIDPDGTKYGIVVDKDGKVHIGKYKDAIDDEKSIPGDEDSYNSKNKQNDSSSGIVQKILSEPKSEQWTQKYGDSLSKDDISTGHRL
ncbi:MAG: hypothetical protein LBP39_03810, partial [Rickettsiales bacterium]|nr:hypothetical protein [Rickettsiales bacterium]